ncbi:GntR family transcriptional regulator [Pendulispora rubella]|uniref:GntR family transcriptional regulator n=1 Tax=Pendulispora rubella TaxID=2741070 RepID=A0ABZ2LHR3_9BACT
MPLYHQLAEELLAQITAGAYTPGARIPSEHELASTYGIGRPTVRQATDSLIQRGVLVRRRGSGTFVRSVPARVELFSLGGTLASFREGGVVLAPTLPEKPVRRRVEEEAHPLFDREVVRIVRVSSVRREPVLLEEMDFDAEYFVDLEKVPLRGQSLSEVVEQRYRMRPVAADQTFGVEQLDRVRAQRLGLEEGTAVLRVERTLHFATAESAIFCRLFCPEGRFVFTQRIGGRTQ